jgi:hypothetical protein
VILHCRKSEFDRVEIGRVGWKKFASHASAVSVSTGEPISTYHGIPVLDQLLDVGVLVNTTVVQNNDGVGCWIRPHIVEEDTNKLIECCCAKRALEDVAMQDAAL